jgi:N-acetylglucosaminyl-diphospho-decaprenol L-rhamnosyltransferase
MLDFDYGRTQYVNAQPAAACLMCRRSAFEQVCGFDERFYFWFEDVDLVRRLVAHGGRIAYVHDAVFAHLRSHTFSQWGRPEIVRARYGGLVRYFAKHHHYSEQLALRAAIMALALVRVPALLVLNRGLARAYLDVAALAARTERP